MTLSRLTSSSLYSVGNGLVGMGNWASVTATTGSPTTGTYTDANGVSWKYYKWIASGSVTLTAGIVDALVVGGGGAEGLNGSGYSGGGGGQVLQGMYSLSASTFTITPGAARSATANTNNGLIGNTTTAFGLTALGGGGGTNSPVNSAAGGGPSGGWYNAVGAGAGGPAVGTTVGPGVTSSITGSAVEYGKGGATATHNTGNTGQGGGESGVVIIRVPSTFALV